MDLWVGLLVLLVSSSSWIADGRFNPSLNGNVLRNKNTCTLCEEFTGEVLDYIGDNKTQTEIIDVLHKSCARAVSFKQECIILVDYYAPLFFTEVSSVQPGDFCRKVNLCEKIALLSLQVKEEQCDLCRQVVSQVLEKLKDPYTQMDIIQILLKACNSMESYAKKRIIRCGGAVDDDMANIIVAQLLYLDAVDPNKDIVMYVNSPGGSVTAGMAIFDTMRHIRPDVSTVCVGLAASMGAFLLSAGTKGKRYSLPNSRIMIHQPLGGAQGGQTDIDIQANEMLHHKANLNGYMSYHTGQSLEKINQDTDRDFFMSAKEAKEYGLIDGVIMNPLKALQPSAAS